VILKWVSKKLDGEAWSDVAEDRDRWRAFVNVAMKLRVPYIAANLLSS